MKKAKTGVKGKQTAAVDTESDTGGELPRGTLVDSPHGGLAIRPFPDDLLEEAAQEPDRVDLAEYWQVIAKLREKGFSYREIAEWLGERKIDSDHNAVYRVYMNHLINDQIAIEAEREERERKLREEL